MTDAAASLGTGENPLRRAGLRKWAATGAAGLALSYPAYLALMFRAHVWIFGSGNRPLITDFLVFWLAGKSALHGNAAAAYDFHAQHLAVAAAAGREFDRTLSFDYPPVFLFVTAALALLPYLVAFVTWLCATTTLYAAVIAGIVRSRIAALVACAAPAVFINAISGQNGCLTAALVGGALLALENDAALGGILLGLLVIKPQLGILIPLVLAASGRWRTLTFAFFTACFALGLSFVAFGATTLPAFVENMTQASHVALTAGTNGWNNLETIYGMARFFHFGGATAWIAQSALALATAATLVWLWRRPLSYALKAAALSTAVLLASPYLHIYDLVILVVPLAFLARDRSFDVVEIIAIALANVCAGAYLFLPTPIGLVSIAVVAGLIARRVARLETAVSAPALLLQTAEGHTQ